MRRSWIFGPWALLALLATAATPASPAIAAIAASAASDAIVPLAPNLPLGAATYRTLLIATHTGGSGAAVLGVTFLPNGADGTTASRQPVSFTLPAGSTLRLYDMVPAGAKGMLLLSGPPEIVVSARMEGLAANGNLLVSAELPVLSGPTGGTASAAGQHIQLVGLEQSAAGAASDFGLVNLASATARCTVQGFRADGSRIGNPVSLSLFPLSGSLFSGALPRLGETAIKDSRFDVTCDQLFTTYALVYRSGGPETVALGPATRLDGALVPDDDGSLHFDLPGEFADGANYAAYDLPLGGGVRYGRARVEFDLYIDRFHKLFPGNPNYETVASFRRSAGKRPDRVLYWGLILKGSGDFRTLLDLGLAPGATGLDGTTLKSGKGPWQERTSYHLVFDYDASGGKVVFQAYQGGNLVQQMEGPINSTDVANLPDQLVRIDFSAPGVGDGAYFPTTGWKYSNLTVRLTPRN
ncbi:MAG TPA: hypothetical protein VGR07_05960 [Thermoanaerobaculia bacterium]|jgi:hypothetical protein|nr:hypothetical protein [Thermoanaerobaculia bacterium]